MDVRQAYNSWAEQYDTNVNRTRDLEAYSLRETLEKIECGVCLEIGCGTGKNTLWLATRSAQVTAVDFSEEMLQKAKEKLKTDNVQFLQADINQHWDFVKKPYDLITFSLVLEHIENLHNIFQKADQALAPGGYVYIGELHPFKQYAGTKARFETADGLQEVTCFTHHLSDFTKAATHNGFSIERVQEYFDDQDRTSIPRILTLLLRRA